ncbi:MAG: glutamine synthetase [Thermoplasmata archaeon]|nr:MAG: glutamine synthetase [Thermoplasmata archaeon]
MEDEKSYQNTNILTQFLKKEPMEFTRKDIINFIKENNIKMLNFNFVGGDGRLKTLSFPIRSEKQLKMLLDCGERVDGSSLFSYIDPRNSDLYVIPRFKTAFLNPFSAIPTLNMLCSYFDANGDELDIAPEYIIKKAHLQLKKKTGINLEAYGELEYYVKYITQESELFPGVSQRSYQESKPFIKYEDMNNEILYTLASLGIKAKYGHSEVGNIVQEDGTRFEQYEIELDLESLEDMADHVVIARWIIRNIAVKYGVEITFAPKIAVGHAGTGLHIHVAAFKKNKNVLLDDNENLSETARRIIGGLLKLAPSITAFGNTNPTSYLRFVPNQEAPTYICWGDKNRSLLIRVPLGWRKIPDLSFKINKGITNRSSCKERQTIELRSPDGSANIHLLLAGIAVAAKFGLTNDESIRLAKECYVDLNISKEGYKKKEEKFNHLPTSCFQSAEKLKEQAYFYNEDDVFNKRIIDGLVKQLELFKDKDLNKKLKKDRQIAEKYIKNFIHWG